MGPSIEPGAVVAGGANSRSGLVNAHGEHRNTKNLGHVLDLAAT